MGLSAGAGSGKSYGEFKGKLPQFDNLSQWKDYQGQLHRSNTSKAMGQTDYGWLLNWMIYGQGTPPK
jgi:hypothetical protein